MFAPTHVSRNEALLERAVEYGLRGGNLDITAAPGEKPVFGIPTRRAVKHLLAGGVSPERITLSSDGNGSMPRFDAEGKLAGMGIGPIESVLACILELMEDPKIGPLYIPALIASGMILSSKIGRASCRERV